MSIWRTLFFRSGPTFDEKQVEEDLGFLIASSFSSKFDFSKLGIIDVDSLIKFLKNVAHSAPGPDGIP